MHMNEVNLADQPNHHLFMFQVQPTVPNTGVQYLHAPQVQYDMQGKLVPR